jgi:hypothetical protein
LIILAKVKLGRGDTFMFWNDHWSLNGNSVTNKTRYPRFCSFALDENIMAAEVYNIEDLSNLFYRPLSQPAFQELQEL